MCDSLVSTVSACFISMLYDYHVDLGTGTLHSCAYCLASRQLYNRTSGQLPRLSLCLDLHDMEMEWYAVLMDQWFLNSASCPQDILISNEILGFYKIILFLFCMLECFGVLIFSEVPCVIVLCCDWDCLWMWQRKETNKDLLGWFFK